MPCLVSRLSSLNYRPKFLFWLLKLSTISIVEPLWPPWIRNEILSYRGVPSRQGWPLGDNISTYVRSSIQLAITGVCIILATVRNNFHTWLTHGTIINFHIRKLIIQSVLQSSCTSCIRDHYQIKCKQTHNTLYTHTFMNSSYISVKKFLMVSVDRELSCTSRKRISSANTSQGDFRF